MAKSLATKYANVKKSKTRKKTVSCWIRESKITFSFVAVLLICVIGFTYMSRINNVATKGYEIENYKKELSALEKENQKMMVELADLKSINALSDENDKFIVIDYKDIAYLTSVSGVVAME